jgi:nucleotide-binding universal stress UspA family protein
VEHASNLVSNEARAADLVIIGRETGSDDRDLALDPGIAILRAGRPVLIVPDEVDSLPARRIMLAWKDTRESRRAVSDALPFLKEATEVMIAEVCESGTETESLRSVEDVATYLRRHGVSVGAKVFLRAEHSVAGELLRFAKDENSDLIVAGGYGHSRLGEWMFGGVTRDLLVKSQVCCLFSH